jgi:hypothetical protein
MSSDQERSNSMSIIQIRPPAVAAVLVAGLLAAGCGGGSEEISGGGVSQASAGSDPGVAYAECMRENGVPEFPDPVDGKLRLRITPDSGIDPNSPEWEEAQQACQDLAPAGAQSGGSPPPELQERVLKHAKCMRENGVPDFPDPSFDGGGVRMQLPPGLDPESQQFQSARRACQELAPQGLGGP